jgi:hypothetical protein
MRIVYEKATGAIRMVDHRAEPVTEPDAYLHGVFQAAADPDALTSAHGLYDLAESNVDAEWQRVLVEDGEPVGLVAVEPPDVLELTTDATDSVTPFNGIPDIPADGSEEATFTVRKRSGVDGAELTRPEDDNELHIRTSFPVDISSNAIQLVDGVTAFTIRGSGVKGVVDVSVYDPQGRTVPTSKKLQFA